MNIVVLLKRVPDTSEEELAISKDGKSIDEKDLPFDGNEPDKYAVEEALRLKEKHGGEVTLVTVGVEEAEEALRMELAKGADRAVHVVTDEPGKLDGHAVAATLTAAIKGLKYDLVLAGSFSTDLGASGVGGAVAEMLGIPHATFVTSVDVDGSKVRVGRELEGGLVEKLELSMPAMVMVQTGLNKLRYASMLGIRKAGAKEVKQVEIDELDGEPALKGKTTLEKLSLPPKGKMAELIPGAPDEAAGSLAQILKGKGLV